MQREWNEEIPRASKETDWRVSDQVCSNPREENKQADHLVTAASAEHMFISSKVLSFVQLLPLIDGVEVQEIDSGSN